MRSATTPDMAVVPDPAVWCVLAEATPQVLANEFDTDQLPSVFVFCEPSTATHTSSAELVVAVVPDGIVVAGLPPLDADLSTVSVPSDDEYSPAHTSLAFVESPPNDQA